jgi:solute carrier family 45 protein 1/2/4
MASWSGQPSVWGSSEAMRMVLLTFSAIGITWVAVRELEMCLCLSADELGVASHGELK